MENNIRAFLCHFCWLNYVFVLLFSAVSLLHVLVFCVSSEILPLAEELEGASSPLRNLGSFLLKTVPHPQRDHSHVPMDAGHRCSCYYGNASTSPAAPAAAPLIGGTVLAAGLQAPGLGKP